MTKLKRCPNCGGETIESWIADYPALRCDKCGIVTILPKSGAGNEKLIEVFNTRTPDIVRCGECRRYKAANNKIGVCDLQIDMVSTDYFCSYGERREEK